MTAEMVFDYIGILLDKHSMSKEDFTINVNLTDTNGKIMLRFNNGALLQYSNTSSDFADLTITCPKNALALILQ